VEWWANNFLRHHVLGFSQSVRLVYVFHQNLATYWIVVAATQGYLYYSRYRQGEVRAAQLSAQLAQAQLQALRMQLHPHFLFNTLNAISTLVHKDPEIADRMIARLSDLLRLTLENIGVQEVRLAKELEFLERYLDIERMRFADRLEVRMQIAPETLDARLPYLILQPLVENAIRHGIAPRSAPGRIEVSAERKDGMLVLTVKDDGPGIAETNPKKGVGVSSTRARLERLYGAAHRFVLQNGAQGGLIVTLALPFQFMVENVAAKDEARDSR
jgi:LytS/YehU family sensor histidine kinase